MRESGIGLCEIAFPPMATAFADGDAIATQESRKNEQGKLSHGDSNAQV